MIKSLSKIYQRPLDAIDGLLDNLTSYRLVLYYLIVVLGWAILASFHKSVPFSWHAIIISSALLVVVCRIFGELFSRILNIARNGESDYITALILALIMSPATSSQQFAVLAGAGFAAIAGKYLLTIHRQHIFNPAAAGALIAGVGFHHYASWWVGTTVLTPLVLAGGLLIMRKMKRLWMIVIFLTAYSIVLLINHHGLPLIHILWLSFTETGVLFLAFIMLTEPLTSPDSLIKYLPYSVLVGLLYGSNWFHVSPEEALLIGNLLAYALVRGKRLELNMAKVTKEAEGIYSFAFNYHGLMDFKAGQYMEWTLPLRQTDSRGNRRYLTLSSSPTEGQLMFTVRMPQKASHFKQALAGFQPNDRMLASHLGGSFTLPYDDKRKLAFIAGGIGVTPFRSMIKYLIDRKQDRSISLLYGANKASEFAFTELFKQAGAFGVETRYVETAKDQINDRTIAEAIPDYKDRLFYISGPYGFVKAVRESLLDLGVGLHNIRSDYFPGYGS